MPDTACQRCPIPNTSCRCLGSYVVDQDAYFAALDAMTQQPARLRVVTPGPPVEPACTGELVCGCPSCVIDRAGRVAQGAGPSELRVRPISERHRKAA